MKIRHFGDKQFVKDYIEQGPVNFVPGFEAMHLMIAHRIAESVPREGSILVLGAGGGHELVRLASYNTLWRFCAVDPSKEMLGAAHFRMAENGEEDRVRWVQGVIDDAPQTTFDAATCLLTLHFVPDDGSKLATLDALRSRLKPGGTLILVDLCIELGSAQFDESLARYANFALASGADREDVEQISQGIREGILPMATPIRNEQLFSQAGFSKTELFYAGNDWRGWALRN